MSGLDVENGIGWAGGIGVVGGATLGEVEQIAAGIKGITRQTDLAGTPYPLIERFGGVAYDFTSAAGDSISGGAVSRSDSVLGNTYLYGVDATRWPVEAIYRGRRVLAAALAGTRFASAPGTPLLPTSGDFTFVFAHVTEATNRQALLWQHINGAAGRVQITANAGFNGVITEAPGYTNFFFEGAADGEGVSGQPRPVAQPVGRPAVYAVVMRDGQGASQIWRNGELWDTFTRPSALANTQASFFGSSAVAGYSATGQILGRVAVIKSALDADGVDAVSRWCAESLGVQWSRNTQGGDLDLVLASRSAVVSYVPPTSAVEPATLFEKAPDDVWYPASLTKVMTAMILLDHEADMGRMLTVLAEDATTGSGNNLLTGDLISVSDAIYNMMLPSSNVTATLVGRVIGETLSGSGTPVQRFVAAMNAKAATLGMSATLFTTPHGLHGDGTAVTTAADMARMTHAAIDYPGITSRWGASSHTINLGGPNARAETVQHSVDMIGDADVLGGKTGTTTVAGANLVLYATMPNGNRVVTASIGAPNDLDRFADTRLMLDAVRAAYDWPVLAPTRRAVA